MIVTKAAQPGEMISPISGGGGSIRTGIGTLVDMDSLEVQVDVNEAYIGRVHPKMPVEAVLNAYPEWKIPGEVIAIIPTADRTQGDGEGAHRAEAARTPRIVPDMGVRVSFLEAKDAECAEADRRLGADRRRQSRTGTAVVFRGRRQGETHRKSPPARQRRQRNPRSTKALANGDSVIASPGKDLKDGADVANKADAAE